MRKIETAPLLTNHIMRCLYQFHGNHNVPPINVNLAEHDAQKQHMLMINYQISYGIDNLLSGALTKQLSAVQKHHIENYNVGKQTSIRAWNRKFITIMLEHTNEIWKHRCEVLHNEEKLTREATMREQAVHLLLELRKDPYQVLYDFRNLLNRTRHYLRTTHVRNVTSWLTRITQAIELAAGRKKTGANDIRWWIEGRNDNGRRGKRIWGELHGLDTDYDSDGTEYDLLRYPDENPIDSSWILRTDGDKKFTSVENICTAST